ncbi:hypothetical protein I302_106303 [Kwoniella bestiolae CBS 10118]|uniref:Rab-GAP TBC domain-containing protein n=1 Tax=Kwoniella bestiolae CBS 10118 TaxID=1296100 RepID=A0A1B9G3H6_9TREE|nr:hypothetical protein I302_05427 [Kwoniella bestiolae CBS 10118]OCF25607.1 hypothetical protein I302_05427 [Kwoniella bestiolae CBS 10118]
MGYLDPRELNDLIALAERGGIGKGVALTDCVAEAPDQLMYISGDELILLRDLGTVLLASCEGVIGWVERDHLKFTSLASTSTPPGDTKELPTTILTVPSPPRHQPLYNYEDEDEEDVQGQTQLSANRNRELKRISEPFELDSPQPSPSLPQDNDARQQGFFEQQQQNGERDSVVSNGSSEAFGGIGGFMMGGNESEDEHGTVKEDELEELKEENSPKSPSINAPHVFSSTDPTSSNIHRRSTANYHDEEGREDTEDGDDVDEEEDHDDVEWDIYDDYARESMYGPAKRMSLAIQQKRLSRAAKAASKIPSPLSIGRASPGLSSPATSSFKKLSPSPQTETFRLPSAEKILQQTNQNESSHANGENHETLEIREEDSEQLTPKLSDRLTPTTPNQSNFNKIDMPSPQGGRSVATELRLRIMREREKEEEIERNSSEGHSQQLHEQENDIEHPANETSDIGEAPQSTQDLSANTTRSDQTHGPSSLSKHQASPSDSTTSGQRSTSTNHDSEESTNITTPQPRDSESFSGPSSSASHEPVINEMTKSANGHSLLASPLPIDDNEVKVDVTDNGIISAHSLVPPPPRTHSPHLHQAPWTPGSPSSPHSISATRQAVDVARSTFDGKRPRGLTLVGRMEADLLASKGPVPITFLVNGPGMPVLPTPPPSSHGHEPIGLGLPSARSRASSPHDVHRRATSPLASPVLANEDTMNQASPFPPHPHPHPVRSATSPVPPSTPATHHEADLTKPSPPFSIGRPRARSFSATVAKTLGVGGKKDSTPPALPALSIQINQTPPLPVPSINSPIPQSASSTKRSFFGGRKSSLAPSTPPAGTPHSPSASSITVNHLPTPSTSIHQHGSTPSLPIPGSARSSSFSFNSKTPKKSSSTPSTITSRGGAISHKDFIEETIKAEGLDFELIQPKRQNSNGALLSPIEDTSPVSPVGQRPNLDRQSTMTSTNSVNSLKPLPETDEWGFLKDRSPVPEIFASRSAAGDHRAIEQKWLSIISTPLPPNSSPPKKVRKLVLDAGVPSSLRGKVWAWFMANTLSARTPGLYQELIAHDQGQEDERIDKDVAGAYPDHSIFASTNSAGQQDLRLILRAYSNFAPSGYRPEMALIAGALLIHCVAEDSFWLLSGLVNSVLKDYYTNIKDRTGLRIDSSVFMGLLMKEEPKLGKLFNEIGLHPISFLDKWFSQLFIRCLPWPTTLRVIDAVVSEGPRFLLIAAFAILTLSKERLMGLQKNPTTILRYLQNLPQDSLLLPENFMRTCDQVRFDEKDYKKLRGSVEKEIMG